MIKCRAHRYRNDCLVRLYWCSFLYSVLQLIIHVAVCYCSHLSPVRSVTYWTCIIASQIRVFFNVLGSFVAGTDTSDFFYKLSSEEVSKEARMRRERLEQSRIQSSVAGTDTSDSFYKPWLGLLNFGLVCLLFCIYYFPVDIHKINMSSFCIHSIEQRRFLIL
jgi:hypothetical protein